MQSEDRRSRPHFDLLLLGLTYAMMIIGVLAISVATYDPTVSADVPLINRIINSETGRWQAIFLVASPAAVWFIVSVPYEHFRSYARLYYLVVLGLLLLTLGTSAIRGVSSWLRVSSLDRMIQPSEFAKITIIIMLARVMTNNPKPMNSLSDALRILGILAVPAGITMLQGEIGSVIVMAFIFYLMLYFGGTDWKLLTVMFVLVAVAVAVVFAYGMISGAESYRLQRIISFLDPAKYPKTGGYQITQSEQAIGSGGLKGVGLFVTGSLSQLNYVPEDWTDFIFSSVGEAIGFLGCAAIALLYLLMLLRMLYLARYTYDKFGRLIIIGVMAMQFIHTFQNIAMTIGLMPITGIPLPFLSYGGSNLLTNVIGISLVLNVVKNRSNAVHHNNMAVAVPTAGRRRSRKKIYVNATRIDGTR
ncbi:MAG: FtsW/RodA/SpoVE family cell cycle protein [Christensenellales bacterium]